MSVLQGIRRFFIKRAVTPLIHLLRMGSTPEQLAWSLAIGIACGINPLLGTTTLLCLALTAPLRLNLVAAQIANHLSFPLELALFFVYIRAGDALFHTSHMTLPHAAVLDALRHQPWQTTRLLWTWEWHALVVWLLTCLVLVPALAWAFTPILRRLARRAVVGNADAED